ncbi:MAG: AarF/ABC1/UbiB kinase family protein [Rhodospirillales bacterium]|nr:AarF/ABC1/UbiB kinase family protein [Alphaproteobacteria bacterium]MCB9986231.1 AarF/ABC1/UbiB kinase family protein [Rhodospirillales bacterium]USO07214.1 MAG: AarF/ABC1/UbiB kinase family protein [Rhodospirillales bacterium]
MDKNRLTSRIGRYTKVSTAMAGLAARLAGEKFLGLNIDRDVHARQLLESLGALKGPIMKIGQILATIPEALPPEYARAFQELQSNAPPMGWPFVRRRMKAELGDGWEKKFASFGQSAAAAASLGQVHKASLHDGRMVACKLQYPDMSAAIEADLNQLKLVFSLYERADSAIDTRHIHAELAARLREELDYNLEARYCGLYADILKDESRVAVPAVVPELSTARLLTSTWLEGQRILDFVDAPEAVRNEIALNLFRAWYVPLYFYGVIHGDPHLGNYSVRPDHGLNLLDFGCVRVFRPAFVGGVIDLYHALQDNDRARAVHAYESWGFENLSNDLIDILNTWARFLYGPLLEDRERVIGQATKRSEGGGMYGHETAIEVHRRLRAAGGVIVPREFVFMDRAALGLGSVFIHLQARINWHKLFNEMIEGFDTAALAARQAEILPRHNLPLPEDAQIGYPESVKTRKRKK